MKKTFKEKVNKYLDGIKDKNKINCVSVNVLTDDVVLTKDNKKTTFGTLYIHVDGRRLPASFEIQSHEDCKYSVKVMNNFMKGKVFLK